MHKEEILEEIKIKLLTKITCTQPVASHQHGIQMMHRSIATQLLVDPVQPRWLSVDLWKRSAYNEIETKLRIASYLLFLLIFTSYIFF